MEPTIIRCARCVCIGMNARVQVASAQLRFEHTHRRVYSHGFNHLMLTGGSVRAQGGSAGVRLKAMLSREVVEEQAAALRHDIAAVGRRYGDLLAVRLPEAAPAAAAAAAVASPAAGGGDGPGKPAAGGEAEAEPAAAGSRAAATWEGDVLLSYRSVEAAERAAAALQGRVFDGRPIVAAVEAVH